MNNKVPQGEESSMSKLSEADEAFIQESERRMPDDGPMSHPNDEPWMVISSEKVRAYLASRPPAPVEQAELRGAMENIRRIAEREHLRERAKENLSSIAMIAARVLNVAPDPQPEAGSSMDVEALRQDRDSWRRVAARLESEKQALARQLSAAPVPECPYPCGWGNLHTLAIRDGAYLARALQEDEPCPTNARATAMRMVDQLITVCRAALPAQPQEQSAPATNSGTECCVAAIHFALGADDGMDFLRLWNEGEFEEIRREWPEAPDAVFIGADPLYRPADQSAPAAGEGACSICGKPHHTLAQRPASPAEEEA